MTECDTSSWVDILYSTHIYHCISGLLVVSVPIGELSIFRQMYQSTGRRLFVHGVCAGFTIVHTLDVAGFY